MNANKPQELRLLTEREVRERTGFGRTFIWKAVRAGVFPRPIKHGRSTRFVESEVNEWIRARIADRDGTTTTERLLFSEREIADALGVSVSLLQKDRVTLQRFPFTKIGANIRYDIEDVRAALKAHPIRKKNADMPATA